MKYFLFLLLAVILLISCSSSYQTEKELRKVLNKPLEIKMFSAVLHRDSTLSFDRFREAHEFISIVYLQDGCQPCYPKFIEWHKKMASLELTDNYTILFVIQGDNYSDFMSKVLFLEVVDDIYYTVVDANYSYLEANNNIPRWIIDASVLIDSENKIKMVGVPWANEDMKNLFYETVSNEQ